MKTLPDVEVYFPKQDGTLAPEKGTVLFSGKLILWEKCLQVADDVIRVKDRGVRRNIPADHLAALTSPSARKTGWSGSSTPTEAWSPAWEMRFEFDAFNLTYEAAKEYGGLAEITPSCPVSRAAVTVC